MRPRISHASPAFVQAGSADELLLGLIGNGQRGAISSALEGQPVCGRVRQGDQALVGTQLLLNSVPGLGGNAGPVQLGGCAARQVGGPYVQAGVSGEQGGEVVVAAMGRQGVSGIGGPQVVHDHLDVGVRGFTRRDRNLLPGYELVPLVGCPADQSHQRGDARGQQGADEYEVVVGELGQFQVRRQRCFFLPGEPSLRNERAKRGGAAVDQRFAVLGHQLDGLVAEACQARKLGGEATGHVGVHGGVIDQGDIEAQDARDRRGGRGHDTGAGGRCLAG